MKPSSFANPKGQAGISLVEIMVALAIGLFMTAIIAGLYINMRGGFRYQEDFARLQEAGRFASEAITRDIRMAGYQGCSKAILTNVVNDGSSNDFLNFAVPIRGYEGGALPATLTAKGAINSTDGPDALVLLGVDSSSELLVSSHDPVDARFDTATQSLQVGEILLATDCHRASVFRMSGPAGATKTSVLHAAGAGTAGNSSKNLGGLQGTPLPHTYKPGSSLLRVYSNTYFIAPAQSGNGRSLWVLDAHGSTVSAVEVIEGIEDMQVTYGVDANGDNAVDDFVKADAVADWGQIVAVRIALLARTQKDNVSAAPQTYEYNGASVTATDRRVRKVFTEQVAVRNRVP